MGLDIYLYTKGHSAAYQAHDEAWEALYARKSSGDITEAEYEEQRANLPDYPAHHDVPSVQHAPPTLNNRRYLRSSYNEGGFNSAVPRYLGGASLDFEPTYYGIFEPVLDLVGNPRVEELAPLNPEHIPEIVPALRAAAERARRVASLLRSTADGYSVTTFAADAMIDPTRSRDHMWHSPPRDADALEWFREVKREADARDSAKPNPFGDTGWSNAKGTYLAGSPLAIVAVVPGVDVLGRPAVHCVYKDSGETIETYAVSADIAAEFAEEAILLIERDGACEMSWSG